MSDDHDPGDHPPDQPAAPTRRPASLDTSTRVNVAFPFSQIRVQEPTKELLELAAVVEGLAELVAGQAPGPEADDLRGRAAAVSAALHRR